MKSCLIVDDSRVVRKVAGRIIQDLKFETREAGDGAEALEACRENMPDAILLDWSMPVMNGLDFIRALRLFWLTFHSARSGHDDIERPENHDG